MAIDIHSDMYGVRTTLNNLLSKYTTLRVIDFYRSENNKPYYSTGLIREGFYYKAVKNPKTGEVLESLRVVPLDNTMNVVLSNAKMVELADDAGNFTRFKLKVERPPNPPSYEWVFTVTPNKEDIHPIT